MELGSANLEALRIIENSTPDVREKEKRMTTVIEHFKANLEHEKEKLAQMRTELGNMMSIYGPQKEYFLRSDQYEKGTVKLLHALGAIGMPGVTAEQVLNLKTAVNGHFFQLNPVIGKKLVVRARRSLVTRDPQDECRPMETEDLESPSGPNVTEEVPASVLSGFHGTCNPPIEDQPDVADKGGQHDSSETLPPNEFSPLSRSPSSPTPSEVEEKCAKFIQAEVEHNLYEREKAQKAQEVLERIRQQENERLPELMRQEEIEWEKVRQDHQMAWENLSKSSSFQREHAEWMNQKKQQFLEMQQENQRKLAEEHRQRLEADQNRHRLQMEENRRRWQQEDDRRQAEYFYRWQSRTNRRFY